MERVGIPIRRRTYKDGTYIEIQQIGKGGGGTVFKVERVKDKKVTKQRVIVLDFRNKVTRTA